MVWSTNSQPSAELTRKHWPRVFGRPTKEGSTGQLAPFSLVHLVRQMEGPKGPKQTQLGKLAEREMFLLSLSVSLRTPHHPLITIISTAFLASRHSIYFNA